MAPDDDAAEMYLSGLDRMDNGRLRAVRDLERRAARPRVAPQPEILDATGSGLASAAARIRPATASAGRTCRPRRSTSRPSRRADRSATERRALSRRGAARGGAVHGPSAERGPRLTGRERADTALMSGPSIGEELQPFVDQGVLIYDGRPPAADQGRNASCSRDHGRFHQVDVYGRVNAFPPYRRLEDATTVRVLTGWRDADAAGFLWRPSGERAGCAAKSNALTFDGDTAILTVAIKPDKTADFEQIMKDVGAALMKSEKPERSSRRPAGRS